MGEITFTITTFKDRKTPIGKREYMTWADIWSKFQSPEITEESESEYWAMTNEQRTIAKDVGGYVAGELTANRRSKAALVNRQIVSIDADYAKPGDAETFLCLHNINCLVHTTHSSTKDSPRLRWLFPLSRPVNAEEYRIVAGELSKMVGVESIDESTDQPERLMFWPSVSFDGEYWCKGITGAEFLDPDTLIPEGVDTSVSAPKSDKPIEDGVLSVGEGQRNKTVFSFAANLRGQGLDQTGIRAILEEYNDRYCSPPLEAWELDTICRSVCSRYEPGAPVAATLRDAWDDFNDLGEWVDTKSAPIKQLEAESMTSLFGRNVQAPVYVVDNLIANGITILASPPKFGKSWMCMDLAISVSNGTEFMGLRTNKCGVIYLALEDGDYRLKERGRKVAGDRPIPSNLYFVKEAPILEEGLLPMLHNLTRSCDGVGMVIIDTLQKVRGTAGRTEGVYGYDYRELGQLHKYALENNIAVVLVHHLNKGGDDNDFVSRLNGSTGISGAADSIITLSRNKRNEDETKMSITGRDIVERTLILQMDWGRYRWIILGEEHDIESKRDEIEFSNDPIVKTVVRHLDEAEELVIEDLDTTSVSWSCSSSELLEEIERLFGVQDTSSAALGIRLNKIVPKMELNLGITHTYERKKKSRVHVFTRSID